MPTVTLKPGHVRPVWSGHPWIFAQAIARIEGGAVAGDEVRVVDPTGNVLGRGLYTPRSAIPVRMFTREDAPIDGALFRRRIERAIAHRRDLGLPSAALGHETDAYRLIHAEGDGLPSLTVDVFGDVLSVQLNTVGVKMREGVIFDALSAALAPRAILDRTPSQRRAARGLRAGLRRGARRRQRVQELRFVERGLRYAIPLALGQKTGFYLDQRALRARVEQLARGRRVLDAFAFVGTFSMAAARGGATEVLAVDESAVAVEVGAECARQNGLEGRIRFVREDARQAFQQARRSRRPPGGFDLVICDPPKLAPSRASKEGALGAYKSLASAACRAVKPGGVLVFCSCSSAVSLDDLTRALALGARDARLQAVVFDRHFQGGDHPVPGGVPRGAVPQGSDRPRRGALRVKPLDALDAAEVARLAGVVFDLDDTLLDHGELAEAAYGALFRLREAGSASSRAPAGPPAGARSWRGSGPSTRSWSRTARSPSSSSRAGGCAARHRRRPARAGRAPRAASRAARAGRRDRRPLPRGGPGRRQRRAADRRDPRHRRAPARRRRDDPRRSRAWPDRRGVRTLVSSIHLHLTLETDDKASGTIRLLVDHFGEDATGARLRHAFVGDSANDAAAFAAFRLTFGVPERPSPPPRPHRAAALRGACPDGTRVRCDRGAALRAPARHRLTSDGRSPSLEGRAR